MLAESSVECGADDAVLVVPWADAKDASGAMSFVDLRENPDDLDRIVEAERHLPLLEALRALNAGRSPVYTAKCDAWTMDAEELEHARINLQALQAEAACGFASYIDLVFRERALFVSLASQQQRMDRLARLLEPLDCPAAMMECVLRPALVDLDGPQEGFAVSMYVKAVGRDAAEAERTWATALEAAVAALRGRELSS